MASPLNDPLRDYDLNGDLLFYIDMEKNKQNKPEISIAKKLSPGWVGKGTMTKEKFEELSKVSLEPFSEPIRTNDLKIPYGDKLKSPKWQRKRLEIMQRDNFTCVACGDTETTLCVHHKNYIGVNPWDTPDKYLVTLCEVCHDDTELWKKQYGEKDFDMKCLTLKHRDFSTNKTQVRAMKFSNYKPIILNISMGDNAIGIGLEKELIIELVKFLNENG